MFVQEAAKGQGNYCCLTCLQTEHNLKAVPTVKNWFSSPCHCGVDAGAVCTQELIYRKDATKNEGKVSWNETKQRVKNEVKSHQKQIEIKSTKQRVPEVIIGNNL